MNGASPSGASADVARTRLSWRVPNRELRWLFLRELIRINCLWLAVYGGTSWLTGLHSYRVRLWTDLDLMVPFVPAAAAVYLSLLPMLWLSVLLLDTTERLASFASSLVWLILLSGIGFLLLPSRNAFPLHNPTGISGSLFRLADLMNLNFNYLPSLHVGMAAICAGAYSRNARTITAVAVWVWALSIALAALLTHQHYLVDIATGFALGVGIDLWTAGTCHRFLFQTDCGGAVG